MGQRRTRRVGAAGLDIEEGLVGKWSTGRAEGTKPMSSPSVCELWV